MEISFSKMQSMGNDFIIIDNRDQILTNRDLLNLVPRITERKFHIGADGVLLLEKGHHLNYRMRLINRDGSEGEMCGNGARCFSSYLISKNLVNDDNGIKFETMAGNITARIDKKTSVDYQVTLGFDNILLDEFYLNQELNIADNTKYRFHYAEVGVPHCVIFMNDNPNQEALMAVAKEIRHNTSIFPKGVNVNFVSYSNNQLRVLTYERGVEDFTYCCGTGSLASSLVANLIYSATPPIIVLTEGGKLTVDFDKNYTYFHNIKQTGDVKLVFQGHSHVELLIS